MKILLSALLAVSSVFPAFADQPEPPAVYAKMKPKTGSWAEYAYETKKGDKTKGKGKWRVAVVGKEGDAFWLEQKMTPELPKPKKDEAVMLMKFLLGKDGIEKAFMKSEHGVMDMTRMMARGRKKQQEAIDKTQAKMKEAGEEKITVAAGTFKAQKWVYEEDKNTGSAWIKPGVGPYGLIKQEFREGKTSMTMELLDSGSGAKSEIDEKAATEGFAGMPDMDAMRAQAEERRAKRKKKKKGGDEEASESSEAAESMPEGEKPSLGGFLKKAMKAKVGLDD